MNASTFVYIYVVIICTMMSFYQQILHSFSCYKVLCIGNLTYAGHFAVCPSIWGSRGVDILALYIYIGGGGVFWHHNIYRGGGVFWHYIYRGGGDILQRKGGNGRVV